MSRGGARVGAGRPAGAATKKTRELADAAALGVTPLEYLLKVMRGEIPNPPPAYLEAAKALLPYMHPRLAPTEQRQQQDDHVPLAERLKAYARQDAIEDSAGKVVEMRKDGTGGR